MLNFAIRAAEHEELAPLIMPAEAFAGVAIAVFVVIGFVVWSYRDVSNRHHSTASDGSSNDSHDASHH